MKEKYILMGIFVILFLALVIADSLIPTSNIELSKERADILNKSGIGIYTTKDIHSGDVFKRCIYSVDEVRNESGSVINYTIGSFNICSGRNFASDKDADAWEKDKLKRIADMLIEEKNNQLEINEVYIVTGKEE